MVRLKKWLAVGSLMIILALISATASAQCSICTKTVQQLGEQPAKGLNAGIIYLAAMPFLIFGYIGYRWYKSYKASSVADE